MSHKSARGHLPHPLSIKPYAGISRAGIPVTRREQLLAALELAGRPLNRRMLGEAARLPINVVCWSVPKLIEAGQVVVDHVAVDPVTRQDTEFLALASPAPVQRSFAGFGS